MLKLPPLACVFYVSVYESASTQPSFHSIFIARDTEPVNHASELATLTIKCLLGKFSNIVVAFDPILDDPDNPRERVLRISNGLSRWDTDYEAVVLRISLGPDSYLILDVLECTESVTFDIPKGNQKPRPALPIWVMRDVKNGLAWVEIDGSGVSPICGLDQIPTLVQTVTDTAIYLGQDLDWQDDRTSD